MIIFQYRNLETQKHPQNPSDMAWEPFFENIAEPWHETNSKKRTRRYIIF